MYTCPCVFSDGSLGTLGYITFKRKGHHPKTKSRWELRKWKARRGCPCGGTLVSAQGERLQAATRPVPRLPHRHHAVGAEPGSGNNRNRGRGPSLPLPCPALPCPRYSAFAEPRFKQKYIIYIFALCFPAFDRSNLFVLVFVGLTVKVYDNSLLDNPIWLDLDIPV